MRMLVMGLAVVFGFVSFAQAEPPKRGEHPNREEMRKKLLEKYDTNQDGKLDETEREAMKKAFAEKRAAAEKAGGKGPATASAASAPTARRCARGSWKSSTRTTTVSSTRRSAKP